MENGKRELTKINSINTTKHKNITNNFINKNKNNKNINFNDNKLLF